MTTVATKPPAISGLSAGQQAPIMAVYPSVAATLIGKVLGQLYDSMPMLVCGIKLSHLLFPLPTAPIAVAVFFHLKIFGEVYVLTNRSVQIRKSLGNRLLREISLADIDQVVLRQEDGQKFYPAADVYLLNKAGQTLMSLPGVSRAEVFRQNLLEARNARVQVTAALSTINARHAG